MEGRIETRGSAPRIAINWADLVVNITRLSVQGPSSRWEITVDELNVDRSVAIPLGWLLFAPDYTGRDEFLKRRYLVLYSLIPIVTIILVALGPYQDLLIVKAGEFHESGILKNNTGGIWYRVVAIYTYVLGGTGTILLFDLNASQTFVFRKQAIALIVGILVP